MQSKQRQLSIQQSDVPPVPMTLWHQLPQSSQQQLAHLIADLIRRMLIVTQSKEDNHEC